MATPAFPLPRACSGKNALPKISETVESLGRRLVPDKGALSPIREATAFSAEHAETAGNLTTKTRPLGLSLGDRACLALGMVLRAPVYTADKSWKRLKLGVPIHLIR
jgi:PIN domain nuclease of toxin-antitoxin system